MRIALPHEGPTSSQTGSVMAHQPCKDALWADMLAYKLPNQVASKHSQVKVAQKSSTCIYPRPEGRGPSGRLWSRFL